MRLDTSRRMLFAGVLTAFAMPIAHAQASKYPSRPIKLIVTFVPGGGADILGRYLAQALTTALGQTVIMDNKPGAGGMLGVEAGLMAPADGYTFTLISSSYTVNPSLYRLKFDLLLLALATSPSAAQTFPTKPIRLVVPFPAGGGTDTIARARPSRWTDSVGSPS